MTNKYTPTHYEWRVVETYPSMTEDPIELQKLKDRVAEKYNAEVSIERHDYQQTEWSWRTDSQYTVDRTEYQVKCLLPVYSAADNQAMHEDAMRAFREKYKNAFKKRLTK